MFASRLQNLKPYIPGEQPNDRTYIKLNANENPYPPPEPVAAAISALVAGKRSALGLYPDPDTRDLRRAYAELLNKTGGVLNDPQRLPFEITEDMVYCGNGSDEVLSFVFYAFFDEKQPVIQPEFTYSFYPVYAGYYKIPLKKIPLCNDWSLDIPAMLAAAGTDENPECSGMIFANPNAPSGLALSRDEIASMLERFPQNRLFVVDEAYMDFGQESVLPLLDKFKNLLVIRTASKSLSLAGMRLGFAVGNPELIKTLTTVKNSVNHFPVDIIAKTAGIAACAEVPYYTGISRKIVETRRRFSAFLQEHGWTVLPSRTNFVLAKKQGVPGLNVYESLKKCGLLVRYFDAPVICDYVRITIGTDEQMNALQNALLSI